MKKWRGDGTYSFQIVGESFYQDALAYIAGPKEPDAKEHICEARLIPDDNNRHDSNAIRIEIDDYQVGYLDRGNAASFRTILAAKGVRDCATRCDAVIVGGWLRGRSEGDYGVRLDIADDLEFIGRRERRGSALLVQEPEVQFVEAPDPAYAPMQWMVAIVICVASLAVYISVT